VNDRISRWVAAWLAHPTGIAQALVTTGIWFSMPAVFHWSFQTAIFWYLAYCTFISFATQFTLAYQNHKAERALVMSLKNQADTMRLLLELAQRDEQTGANLAAAVTEMDAQVDRMVATAIEARQIHMDNAKLIRELSMRNRTIIQAALDTVPREDTDALSD